MRSATRLGIALCLIGAYIPTAVAQSRLMATAQPALADSLKERPPFGSVREPHHAVRTLSAVQERIAHGDRAAVSSLRGVTSDIAAELKDFSPDVWHSIRNRQALVKFVLSGGDPEILRKTMEQKFFEDPELPLAQATLAYAEGQRVVAMRLFANVDISELSPSLAGHVALVKAIVIGNTDLAKVMQQADDARLLSPGTLIEETALRLAIEAAISLRNREKFEGNIQRYFRRFPRSPYLSTLIAPVAITMAEGGYVERADGAKWLQAAVQYLDPNRLIQFYGIVAESGLRGSKLATTAQAARMVRKYARESSPEFATALAYEGAATIVGPEGAKGLALLDAAEAAGVPAPIGELISKARAMAKIIQSPPAPVLEQVSVLGPTETQDGKLSQPIVSVPQDATKVPLERSESAIRVATRISRIDKFLEELD